MKKLIKFLMMACVVCSLVGCERHDEVAYKKKLQVKTDPAPSLDFDRYEEVLFHLDTARFQQELMAIQDDYLPFLSGDLENPDAIKYLKEFVIDTVSVSLYRKVMALYPDLDGVKKTVEEVYRHFHYYYPEIPLPQKVYTCVSGVDPQTPSVLVFDDAVVISLDWYLDGDQVYDWIGMPQYRSARTVPASLAKDLAQQLYNHFLLKDRRQTNVLEEMMAAGKLDFFAEAMCPSLTDEVLLGYTPEQLVWAETNEGELWADIVGNQRLYATDLEMFRTFFSDGPFTNEYSYDAPPRLGEFVGLHVIRSYMSFNDCSLRDLMSDNDLQGIFQASNYKPKK